MKKAAKPASGARKPPSRLRLGPAAWRREVKANAFTLYQLLLTGTKRAKKVEDDWGSGHLAARVRSLARWRKSAMVILNRIGKSI